MLSLIQAVLIPHLNKQEQLNKKEFENYYVFCFAWAFGGLFETEERIRFHKEILEKIGAPLPAISAQKQNFDKETMFDYYVDPETRQWKMWVADSW